MPEVSDTTITLLRDLITNTGGQLAERLGAQDKMLESIQREVRRTNGRVTSLEERNAVQDGKTEVRDGVLSARSTLWWRLTQALMMVCSGAVGGAIGHAAGFW